MATFKPLLLAVTLSGLGAGSCNGVAQQVRTIPVAMCENGYIGVPMTTLQSGHHLVNVEVNGKVAHFVVDSGAGRTVVHDDYVSQFGLNSVDGSAGTATGAGGVIESNVFSLTTFSVGGYGTGLKRIVSLNLGSVVAALEPLAGTQISGVIGQDVLTETAAFISTTPAVLYIKVQGRPLDTRCADAG
jgi:hypothetical protein